MTAALNEPETYDAYSYMSEGVTVEEDETPNPNYVSGTKRQVYLFLNEFLPGGHSKEYLQFILEQLSDLEEISYRAMMGEYIIYYRDRIVGS